jgi:hypothetical protein
MKIPRAEKSLASDSKASFLDRTGLFFCLLLLLLACNAVKESAVTMQNSPSLSQPETQKMPEIIFIPEMQEIDEDSLTGVRPASSEEIASFMVAWQQLMPWLVMQEHADSLVHLSKWAVEQMKSVTLPADWSKQIPMRPLGVSADEKMIRFGQYKEEGFPLPSHHPLVFRRLVLHADYDRAQRTIARVMVSIQGWVEE